MSIQVEAEGAAVGHLEQKQFVGSMAFNRFIQASPSETPQVGAATADPLDVGASANGDRRTSSATTITIASDNNSTDRGEIRSVPASLGDNERDEIDKNFMDGEAYHDDNENHDDDHDDDDDHMYVVEDNSYIPGGGGVFEEAKEVALNVLRRDSIVGNIAMAQSFVLEAEGHRRRGAGEMERSGTTVTATSEVRIAVR